MIRQGRKGRVNFLKLDLDKACNESIRELVLVAI